MKDQTHLTLDDLKSAKKLLKAAAIEGDLYMKDGNLYDENGIFICSIERANAAIDVAVTRIDEC